MIPLTIMITVNTGRPNQTQSRSNEGTSDPGNDVIINFYAIEVHFITFQNLH